MQGLLARLKTLNQANPDLPNIFDDGGRSKLDANNFTRVEDVKQTSTPLQNGLSVESIDKLSECSTARTESDVYAIDMVMSSNTRHHSKSRTSVSTLSTHGKARGTRMSEYSDRDDLDTEELDSDDEACTSKATTVTTAQAWAAFENSIRVIDDSPVEYFVKKPKPNFVSSETFQSVMIDMYGNKEYGVTRGYTKLKEKISAIGRASSLATRMFTNAAAPKIEEGTDEPDHESEEVQPAKVEEPEEGEQKLNKVFAKRGWKVLKRQVNETALENKTTSTKMQLAVLKQAVKQMTNAERTRQDLYERYGIVPTVLEDGTTIMENRMLSDRARDLIYGRASDKGQENKRHNRPSSYQPLPTYLRALSRKTKVSSTLPQIPKLKQRPTTAKR